MVNLKHLKVHIGDMPKLKDINEAERDRAKVNSKGIVLCIHCEKYPSKISEYGMLRRCTHCEGMKFGPTVSIDEPSGRRSY
jgi:uncharacterized CHY-type Zn-finger protein